jgi:hypothetical protein
MRLQPLAVSRGANIYDITSSSTIFYAAKSWHCGALSTEWMLRICHKKWQFSLERAQTCQHSLTAAAI